MKQAHVNVNSSTLLKLDFLLLDFFLVVLFSVIKSVIFMAEYLDIHLTATSLKKPPSLLLA